ncbi:MAG: glycosyltransferase family 2 protein [Proteobacteria bacterium]|nr:glycosyltransferase family 2 protein [Pseudomonadota bacterium]MCP4920966.1 glycosyltransferase family 2 protein [Pseudomonadota bacterium]
MAQGLHRPRRAVPGLRPHALGHDREPAARAAGAVLRPALGLAIPLYDEEELVADTVGAILQALTDAHIPHRLALVNNGSTDGTPALINRLALKHDAVSALHLAENAGYGGGILAGMNSLDTPVVGWCWGDGQTAPQVLVAAWQKLVDEQLDLVKSNRVERRDGNQRRFITTTYNAVMRHGFGLDTDDVNGCPKLMTARAYDALQLRSLDWFLDPECMLRAVELGLDWGEVEAVMLARQGGVSKVRGSTVREFLEHLWAWKGGWRP